MKHILRKTFLVLAAGIMSSAAWADVLPTPVYFNNFETAVSGSDGIEIVGNGVFESDADARFGRIFHNDPGTTPAKKFRTNFLKLPTTLLSSSGANTSKKLTVGFWVNKKNAVDFYNSPIFTAYNAAPTGEGNKSNTWPMMAMETRGILLSNNYGIFNSENSDNVNGTNTLSTAWLDDGNWHYYTCVITETTCVIYCDGRILNSFLVDNSDDHNLSHIFGNLNNLTYVCLGGNQAWDWSGSLDIDPAFGFDDFAVYDAALTQAQINEIINNKLVKGARIGKVDCSTVYLSESSNKIVLRPGESAKFRFVNYIKNTGASNNEAWHLIVADPDNTNKIVIRADWWDDLNGTEVAEHQRGFSSDAGNYWDNVPSKMNWATVDMEVSFTADKKFVMTSTTTPVVGDSWTYNYTSDNANNIDLTGFSSLKVALSVNLSWIDILSNTITTTIGDTGWGTFANGNNLDFSAVEGLKAYIVTGHTGTAINKSQVLSAPASTGLLLKGSAGTAYTIPIVASSSTDVTSNCLKAGTGASVAYDVSYDKYVLVNDGGAKFKKIGSSKSPTVATNRAYLQFTAGSLSRDILDIDGGDATGINMVNGEGLKINGSEVYYNLQGQRVLYPTKGLFIVNGKKVIIK